MKLHFISLNNFFVSIHVVVRFTLDYPDVMRIRIMLFFQIPGLFRCKSLNNVLLTSKIVSEYDQEIPQSQTADKPMAS